MSNIDYSMLDGRALRTFLTVLEEGSVSHAAERLEITQSAVSHTLDKLRVAFGDPLFVRSGRGILPTERAKALREPVQKVLNDFKALTDDRTFDPSIESMNFTIAANDFQRELFFPPLSKEFVKEGIDVGFHFLPSGVPVASLLRDARCQLILTPFPPEGDDIIQLSLFQDQMVCFFDVEFRKAPETLDEYTASDYIDVRFLDNASALSAVKLIDSAKLKRPKITVPNFSDIAAFMKDTNLITTQISSMKLGPLKEFEFCKVPFDSDPLNLFMVWHRRDHTDPAHKWLRSKIKEVASRLEIGL
jgi:DNA-binding transcriptional LysR family regulator